jgi:hypothetical protein
MPEPYECPYRDCSPAVQLFLHEIEGLCRKYGMQLAVSGTELEKQGVATAPATPDAPTPAPGH